MSTCIHCGNNPTEPLSLKSELHCSACDVPESEAENEYLTECTVIIADGEEGFAHITQYWCNSCLIVALPELKKLGFRDHRHGSINYLEDTECTDGYANCAKQSEYGQYIVQ